MDLNPVLLKGAVPLAASIIPLLILVYVGAHKLKRSLLYNIGSTHVDEGANTKKMSVFKAFELFKSRLLKDRLAAINHSFIMIGFMFFLLGFLINSIQIIFNTLSDTVFLKDGFYNITSLIFNIGITMMLIGSLSASIRRLSGKTARLGKSGRHMAPLLTFLCAALAGLLFEGFKNILSGTATWYSFAGKVLFLPLKEVMSGWDGLQGAYLFSWCLLCLAAMLMVFSLIKNKMPHMSAAMLNLMNKKEIDIGRLKNTETQINSYYKNDSELDDEAVFGTKYIEDLDKSQLNQLDACAECGRCDSVCPAYLSNKKLSPQKLTIANREVMSSFKDKKQSEITNADEIKEMAWECNMCYACENECPSLIEHVDRISGIRRNLVMNEGETLTELKKVLNNVNKSENAFGFDNSLRENLLKELDIPYLEKGKKVDYVLWLGCHAYFDDRMKSVIKSMLNIFKKAGKTFAVLKEETCCGDTVRRIGDEFKFQEILKKNNQIFAEYGLKDILTLCPHCFNTFKTEYPTFGETVKAIHYLEVLKDLIKNINKPQNEQQRKKIFYHDSCYLGRISKLYEQPRQLLEQVNSTYELVAIENEKEDSLCCGGGGARVWCEEKIENRPSMIKMKILKEKNVDIILTSCPYCLSIFNDAKNNGNAAMEVMDLMELLDKSLA